MINSDKIPRSERLNETASIREHEELVKRKQLYVEDLRKRASRLRELKNQEKKRQEESIKEQERKKLEELRKIQRIGKIASQKKQELKNLRNQKQKLYREERKERDYLTISVVLVLVAFGFGAIAVNYYNIENQSIVGHVFLVLEEDNVVEKENLTLELFAGIDKTAVLRIEKPIVTAVVSVKFDAISEGITSNVVQNNEAEIDNLVIINIGSNSIYAGALSEKKDFDITQQVTDYCNAYPCDLPLKFNAQKDSKIVLENFNVEYIEMEILEPPNQQQDARSEMPSAARKLSAEDAEDEQYYPDYCKRDEEKQTSFTENSASSAQLGAASLLDQYGYGILGEVDISNYVIKKHGDDLIARNKLDKNSISKFEMVFDEINSLNSFVIFDRRQNKTAFVHKINNKNKDDNKKQANYIVEFKQPSLLEQRTKLLEEVKEKEKKIEEIKTELSKPSYHAVASSLFGNEELERAEEEKEAVEHEIDVKLTAQKQEIEIEQQASLDEIINIISEVSDANDNINTNQNNGRSFTLSNAANKVNKDIVVVEKYKKVFNGAALAIDDAVAENLTEKISQLPNVKAVYENSPVFAAMQDSVKIINADDVWKLDKEGNDCTTSGKECLTGKGITVAIIDTGIDYTHPDLGGCLGSSCKVIGGYDFINDDGDPMDDQGHGTHVAGTVAANGAIKGVAPDAKLVGYKVLNARGSGSFAGVIAGIERAVDPNSDGNFDDKANIMSLSLGGPGDPDDPVSKAIDNAVDNGVVVIVAAGNSGPFSQTIGSPGTARKAITVGAVDKCDKIADFSSRGPVKWSAGILIKPDVAAPGVEICSSQWDSWLEGRRECSPELTEHIAISGTSMATPHVSGVAALLLQAHPGWNPEKVKSALMTTAKDLGYDANTQGAGRVDALKAIFPSISVSPQSIAFKLDGKFEAEQEIVIENLQDREIILQLDAGKVKDEEGNEYDYAQFSEQQITIPRDEKKSVILKIKADSNVDSLFEGAAKIIIVDKLGNGDKRDKVARIPFGFSKLSQLSLRILDLDDKPLKDSWIILFDQANQNFVESVSKSVSSLEDVGKGDVDYEVKGGRKYIAASIDSYLNPQSSRYADRYIEFNLAKEIDVPVNSKVQVDLRIKEAKPITIKAKSFSDVPLDMIVWMRAFKVFDKEDMLFSVSSFSNSYDDRLVYVSKRANDKFDFDNVFKFIGVPRKDEPVAVEESG